MLIPATKVEVGGPLGLDSFRIQDGILSIVASRIAPRIEAGFVQQRVVQGTNSYQ